MASSWLKTSGVFPPFQMYVLRGIMGRSLSPFLDALFLGFFLYLGGSRTGCKVRLNFSELFLKPLLWILGHVSFAYRSLFFEALFEISPVL